MAVFATLLLKGCYKKQKHWCFDFFLSIPRYGAQLRIDPGLCSTDRGPVYLRIFLRIRNVMLKMIEVNPLILRDSLFKPSWHLPHCFPEKSFFVFVFRAENSILVCTAYCACIMIILQIPTPVLNLFLDQLECTS
jgi:hypothetical protein